MCIIDLGPVRAEFFLNFKKVFKKLAHAATAAHTTHEGVMEDSINTLAGAGHSACSVCFLFCFHYFVFNLFFPALSSG
jgi:hypothetical protein